MTTILPEGLSREQGGRFRLRGWAIRGFIAFYVYSAIVMAIPPFGGWLEARLLAPVAPLVSALGLYHRLRLFSPEPPKFTGNVRFQVGFPNGISYVWDYPRSVMMPLDPPGSFNRYLFNYVFWSYGDGSRLSLPALARYVAAHNEGPDGPPDEVRIVEELVRIPAPEKGVGNPLPPHDTQIIVCDYDTRSGEARFADRVPFW